MTQLATIKDFVKNQNDQKILFTAGPASLLPENIEGLQPCFGRGDPAYTLLEEQVMENLRAMTGHQHLVRMQGSGSLAIEIMISNFLYGNILVIDSGYYSDRLYNMATVAKKNYSEIKKIVKCKINEVDSYTNDFDWILACSTETSCALLQPISDLKKIANERNSKLMVDATASIGLEEDHDLADVISYSSCKGLFGLTGAAFVAYNVQPKVEINSFYLSLTTHINKGMTGPYHAICSLANVLVEHEKFANRVKEAKRKFLVDYQDLIMLPDYMQPNLCTWVRSKTTTISNKVVLYEPRSLESGSVVCHIGGVHLEECNQGLLFESINFE
jgi:aspartate aminotransferase-like enzyme